MKAKRALAAAATVAANTASLEGHRSTDAGARQCPKQFIRLRQKARPRGVALLSGLAALLAVTGPAGAQSVLIDSYYSDWIIDKTSFLKQELTDAGYAVDYNTSAITPAKLAGYDVYAVFFPGQTRLLTATDAAVIHAWTEAGGGLWLGGSRGGVRTTVSCNNVSTRWGVTFQSDNISGNVTDITHGHPVTDGPNPPATRVDVFSTHSAASLTVAGGQTLARYPGDWPAMSVVTPAAGRAVLIGDSVYNGPFDDDRLYDYDNLDLALNTTGYLVPEPATLALLGLGAIGLFRRTSRPGSRSKAKGTSVRQEEGEKS